MGHNLPYGARVWREKAASRWTDTIMSMPTGKQPAPGPFARAFSAHVRMVIGRDMISISALADAAGMSRNYLGKRLRDEVAFTLNDVEQICAVFGVEPPELTWPVNEEDAPPIGGAS